MNSLASWPVLRGSLFVQARFGTILILLTVVVQFRNAAAEQLEWSPPRTNAMRDLSDFLNQYRAELKFPALAAAVVSEKEIIAAGAVGERKIDSGKSITVQDKFHLGSCTKSMTALLAAELVVEKKIDFDTSVATVFPEWNLDGENGAITLRELLRNRSGLPTKPDPGLWARAFGELKGGPTEQRVEFLRQVLQKPLEASPGAKFIYSNLGFALAGAMLEKVAGQSWEELVRRRIFEPLGLESAGFGPPDKDGDVSQPWGHQISKDQTAAIPPSDNPVAIAPAGLAHMSVLDTGRYAAFVSALYNGEIPQLAPVRKQLFTPPEGGDYAMGWLVVKRDWAGGTALTHTGSNTMFYCVIWIAPARHRAFVVMTNIGEREGNTIDQKCDRVVAALIKKFSD